MMENKARLEELFQKYLADAVTAPEREEFFSLMNSFQDSEISFLLDGWERKEIVFRERPERADLIFSQIINTGQEGKKIISGASLGNDLNHGDRAAQRGTEGGHEDAETRRGTKDSSRGSELEVNHGDTETERSTEMNTDAEIPLVDQDDVTEDTSLREGLKSTEIPSLAQEEEGHEDAKKERDTKDSSQGSELEVNHGDTGTQSGKVIPLVRKGLGDTEDASLREDMGGADVPSQAQEGERKVIRIWKWLAAAVVIGLMVGGAWWMLGKDNKVIERPAVAVTPKQQDVAPGKDGAILTLADGTQIVLDSAGNGKIAQQGGTKILNEDGKLTVQNAKGNQQQVVYNLMTTPKGRQYTLVLADGSKVWLNAASSIRFPTAFTGSTRVVEITGEAYFEVAHNAAKPFIVSVNDMQVEVLGTHFNINSYTDEPEIKTTLLEGKVRVTKNGSIGILKPGQQAVISGLNHLTIKEADVEAVMAWKNGYLQFNHTDLQTVLRQLARWYDVEVEYKGAIPEQEFGGEIQMDLKLSEALKVLEKSGVKFRIEGRKIVVG